MPCFKLVQDAIFFLKNFYVKVAVNLKYDAVIYIFSLFQHNFRQIDCFKKTVYLM